MALLGLSLVLVSVVYAAIWRPPFVQTLLSIWRGDPQIQQPPTTRRPAPADVRVEHGEEDQPTAATTGRDTSSSTTTAQRPTAAPAAAAAAAAERAAMPPLPIIKSQAEFSPSPQTTPKATASVQLNGDGVPSFSLYSDPPASAASVARVVEASTLPSALPTFSVPSPPPKPIAPIRTSMAPPPRPPTLNNINSTGSGTSLLGVPSRGSVPSRHQYDRQPGTSTLAPPPTHSSKPAKPSRKVTLEPGRSPLDWARLSNNPSVDLRNLGPGAPYLRVPPSILRRQTGRKGKDAWTALGGRVYNITPYIPFHPGGEPELLRAAGRDGTKLFGEIHPWVNYETMLSSCLIGLLVEEHEVAETGEMDAMD